MISCFIMSSYSWDFVCAHLGSVFWPHSQGRMPWKLGPFLFFSLFSLFFSLFSLFFSNFNKNVCVCEQWSWDHYAFRNVVCFFLQVSADSSVLWDICAVIAASLRWGRATGVICLRSGKGSEWEGCAKVHFYSKFVFCFPTVACLYQQQQ